MATDDVRLGDGRVLRIHTWEPAREAARLTVLWQHGTPNVGEPPEPLLPVSERLGIRWVGFDRPGYGGSTSRPGRRLASVAGDAAAVADHVGVERFAVMGHSGGASHALATAAVLADRVSGAVLVAPLAPRVPGGLADWFDGMGDGGAAELRAAVEGRSSLERHLAETPFDPEQFTPSDHRALAGPWSWLGDVAERALAGGVDGMVDDDLALVADWGCDLDDVRCPVLVVHGDRDRIAPAAHGAWIADRAPDAALRRLPDAGHVSVLTAAEESLGWLRAHAGGRA